MLQRLKALKIVQSFLMLKGNTRFSVVFEPLFGISFVFYNFYLSLYLKEMGITETQFGIILAAGFMASTFFSPFGGIVTDYLGRKKTTFVFDFIAWPLAIFIYLISRSLLVFVLAAIANNLNKIVSVSWNLMLIEDGDSNQRKAAYNLINIINIAVGIITPLAGLVVARYGIIISERIFMIFAIISMTLMIVLRNRAYTETAPGKLILAEHKGLRLRDVIKRGLFRGAWSEILENHRLRTILILLISFNLTLPLGGFSSLYFAPFVTGELGIGKAEVSVLGGVYAGVMLFVFLVINPALPKRYISSSILAGLVLQAIALAGLILAPAGVMFYAILAVGLYSFGYGIFLPYLSTIFADLTEGRERASIYSFSNTVTSILSALIGAVSGVLYAAWPRLIFIITVAILILCILVMLVFVSHEKRHIKTLSVDAPADSR